MELEVIKFIQSFSNPFLDNVFEAITMLGEESIYIVILGVIFWCVDKKYGYKLAFAFLFSSIINDVVKNIFKAARPLGISSLRHLRVDTATGYSFPSGHTQNITSFFTSIMKKYRRTNIYIGGSILIFMVAVSRLYLGVHWPKDVIGGVVFGILCVFCADYIFDYADNKKNKYILLTMLVPVIIFLIIFNDSPDLFKASGVFFSFQVGYFIEDKYIKFTVRSKIWKQLIKCLLGIAGALILKSVLKNLLPETVFSDFIRYFITGIWIVVFAPLIFKICNLTGSELKKINNNEKFQKGTM